MTRDRVTAAQAESSKPRTPRWRRWLAAVALIILALAVLVAPIGGVLLKSKLQWMVSSHLNADLKTSSILYIPPYGLVAWDAKLTMHSDGKHPVELISVKRLQLKLADIP